MPEKNPYLQYILHELNCLINPLFQNLGILTFIMSSKGRYKTQTLNSYYYKGIHKPYRPIFGK